MLFIVCPTLLDFHHVCQSFSSTYFFFVTHVSVFSSFHFFPDDADISPFTLSPFSIWLFFTVHRQSSLFSSCASFSVLCFSFLLYYVHAALITGSTLLGLCTLCMLLLWCLFWCLCCAALCITCFFVSCTLSVGFPCVVRDDGLCECAICGNTPHHFITPFIEHSHRGLPIGSIATVIHMKEWDIAVALGIAVAVPSPSLLHLRDDLPNCINALCVLEGTPQKSCESTPGRWLGDGGEFSTACLVTYPSSSP